MKNECETEKWYGISIPLSKELKTKVTFQKDFIYYFCKVCGFICGDKKRATSKNF